MNEDELTRFRTLDWEDITAKLLQAAISMAVRYGWTLAHALPGGNSLDGIVVEAISDIWKEPTRLNPEVELLVQLRGIVRSKLWNLSQRRDEDVKGLDDLAEPFALVASELETVDTIDEFQRAIQLLLESPRIKGREDLELLVIAISDGAVEVEELIRETGFSRERIYQLQRELRVIYPSIAIQLLNQGQQS